jgi:drug/metabolite transporter (DMT)-like permease
MTSRALTAVALVLGATVIALSPAAPEPAQIEALLLSLPAPVSFALIVVVLAAMTAKLNAVERVGCGMAGAVAGLLPAVLAGDAAMRVPESAGAWALIAGMVAVTATGPQLLYVFAAPLVGASRSAVAGALELPTMIAVGWLAFAEAIGPADLVAALLIVVAIATAPRIIRNAPVSAPVSAPNDAAVDDGRALVGDGAPMQDATMSRIGGAPAMQNGAVVPDQQIVGPPVVPVYEPRLHREGQ